MTLIADGQTQVGDFRLDVHLRVDGGCVLAVLGPNGAGKTTLLRALAGDQPLLAGRIELDGRVLDEPATATFVRPEDRRVSTMHQDLLLFPHLSALDNVAFGLRLRGLGRSEARSRAAGWLERLGVADRAAVRPDGLSGGEAQRVALARALAVEPDLLLLDEPLSALDAENRPATRTQLRRWLAQHRGPTVLVTHDPADVDALADAVIQL